MKYIKISWRKEASTEYNMALGHNPSIITSNLLYCIDAGNARSYPGSGTTVYDVTTSGYNGTLVNGPTYTSGTNGYFTFDNVDDYISLPFAPPRTNLPFSFFSWVYLNSTPGAGITNGIWGHYGVSGVNCHFETYTTYTRIRLGDINNSSLAVFPTGAWTYAGFTTTGTEHKYYVNGSLSATWSGAQGAVLGNPGGDPIQMIGRSDAGRTWNGRISYATLYLATLTDSQILTNYNALRGRYGV